MKFLKKTDQSPFVTWYILDPIHWSDLALHIEIVVRANSFFKKQKKLIKFVDLNINRIKAENEYHNNFNNLRDRLLLYYGENQ